MEHLWPKIQYREAKLVVLLHPQYVFVEDVNDTSRKFIRARAPIPNW